MSRDIGRPTKYDPSYCDLLIEHMAKGLSYETFASVIGVNRDTIYHWEELYPEFSDAKSLGKEASQLFWEQTGVNGTVGNLERFNASAWIFNMKNRFKWVDRSEVDQRSETTFTINKDTRESIIEEIKKAREEKVNG